MQKFVDWLLERRAALIVIAVVFAPNVELISSALIGMQWAHRGAAVAFGDALLASLAITVVAIVAAGGLDAALPLAMSACFAVLLGCIVGALLRSTRSLNLALQILLLLGFAGIVVSMMFESAFNALFDARVVLLVDMLRQQQMSENEIADLRAVLEVMQPRFIGLYGFYLCLNFVLALLLTAWLLGYARKKPDFGSDFRAVRIGHVLSVVSAAVVVLTLVLNWTLLHNLFGIATLAFLLQGCAVLHRHGNAAGWLPLQYVPIYMIGVLFGSYVLIVGIFGEGIFV